MHKKFQEFVAKKWILDRNLIPALSHLALQMRTWIQEVHGKIFLQNKKLLARIAGIQRALSCQKDKCLIELEAKLRLKLDDILEKEEIHWY